MAVGSGAGVTAGSDIEEPAWVEEGVAVGVGVGVADNPSVAVSAVGEEGVAAGVCSGSWQAARNSPAEITASRQKRNGATRGSYIRPLPAASGWHDSGVTAKDTVLCCLDAKPHDGRILVAGGFDGLGPLSAAEIYDPSSGSWSPAGPMPSARWNHTATLLPDGTVLVVGGWDGSVTISTAEVYDPATGGWSSIRTPFQR